MQPSEIALLDLICHPVFVIEPDEQGVPRYAAFNRFASNVLGRPADEIIGLTAQELYPGRLGLIAYQHHAEALRSGVLASYEIVLPLNDTEQTVRTDLRPVLDDDGAVLRLIGSSTNLTGQQILRGMQVGAETLRTDAEMFVNLAAHDLRAPLRHVHGIAEMLREGFQDMGDGKLELIDMLEELAAQAMTLISDVLGHAEAVSAAGETVCFEVTDLLDELMAVLDPMGNCDMRSQAVRVSGDRTALQIVLRNLIENAIKYAAPDAEARAVIAVELSRAEDGFVEWRLSDNGPGFFRPDALFSNPRANHKDGGFGLMGIQRLIAARGGAIAAENRPEGGALIRFTMPGRIETAADAGWVVTAAPAGASKLAKWG